MAIAEPWGLTLEQADERTARAAVAALAGCGIGADVVHPRRWLTWHLDPDSVEGLIAIARAALASGLLATQQDIAGAESIAEDCRFWLDHISDPAKR